MERFYTISAFTENTPGVLHRLVTVLTRRKVNIESLTVSETEQTGISRFTILVKTTPEMIKKILKPINRIIEVLDIFVSENFQLLFREIAFIRVCTEDPAKRPEIEELAHRYNASIVHAESNYLIIEKTGSEEEISSLYLLLEPYGMKEFVRSGRIALEKSENQ